jgi:ABC-type transport system involved in multi-copper enzyme maturation permease subunit
MIRLLVVEARRALARGVTRLLLVVAVVGVFGTGIGVFIATKDAATIHADEAAANARGLESFNRYNQPYDRGASLRTCVEAMTRRTRGVTSTTAIASPDGSTTSMTRDPDDWSDVNAGTGSPARIQAYCEAQNGGPIASGDGPTSGTIVTSSQPNFYYGPKVFDYTTNLWKDKGEGALLLPASLLFFGGLIAGASLIGSEWQTGSFVMFLTWEPRRVRIFLAKAAVHAALAFVIGMVLLILFALVLYPTGAVKGTTDGITGEWLQSLSTAMLRMSLITAFAAALGSSLAMIGRRTALALIGVIAYLFIVENLVSAFVESVRPWLLGLNIAVFMTGTEYTSSRNGVVEYTRGPTSSGLTLLGYTVAFVVLAAAAFRRRDFVSS